MRIKYLVLLVSITLCFAATTSWAQDPTFIRGDVNDDGIVDRADSTMLHAYIYTPPSPLTCLLAADVDDNGMAEMMDLVAMGSYLNAGGSIPPPFPDCGTDPTNPQPGDDCCIKRGAAPSLSLMGGVALVLLITGCALWVIRRKRIPVTNA